MHNLLLRLGFSLEGVVCHKVLREGVGVLQVYPQRLSAPEDQIGVIECMYPNPCTISVVINVGF